MMSLNPLQGARALTLPSREAMLYREPSVEQFWNTNQDLLSHAWQEWEVDQKDDLLPLDSSLLDKDLRNAVTQAWQDPTKELAVQDLLQEVASDVFRFQFFDPKRLADLRDYLESVWDAQIPLRPPYGIVLNRRGAMLDSRSEGYLAAPSFQTFYRQMIDMYMRPIARMLFPEIIGYDNQAFGFSIHYRPNTDNSIRPHTDASAVTLNINLNPPDALFTGSTVDFYDSETGKMKGITFTPGSAILHRGKVVHAAQPITSGERTNFVLWLFGEQGRLPSQGAQPIPVDASERWTLPTTAPDDYAPF